DSLKIYVEKIEEIFKGAKGIDPSPEFSALIAMLGSGALFDRHLPRTLGDIFTLVHQNLLACVGYILVTNISEEIALPPLLKVAFLRAPQFRNSKLISIHQDLEKVVFVYNTPLRNHSSKFKLIYEEGRLFISMQLLGQARQRWTQTNLYLKTLDTMKLCP